MPSTLILGSPAGPDGAGGAFQNPVEADRAALWDALGGQQKVIRGFGYTGVAGQMALEITANSSALVAERAQDGTASLKRGYHLYTPGSSTTLISFDPASASDRNDAVVAAFVDTEDGALGTGVSQAGPQIVVVTGVSGTTTPRSDADINTWIGRGGWIRLFDVPIAAGATEINTATISPTAAKAGARVEFMGRAEKASDTTGIGASKVNLLTVTIPGPVNGARYRARAQCCPMSDTAGGFTEVYLQHAVAAVVGGTVFANSLIDHRVASRRETAHIEGDFVYSGADGVANYNVVLVATGGGGTSTDRGATTPTRMWVERIE